MITSPQTPSTGSQRFRAPRPAPNTAAREQPRPDLQAPRAARRNCADTYTREEDIDAAIEMTFPASDPPSWTL